MTSSNIMPRQAKGAFVLSPILVAALLAASCGGGQKGLPQVSGRYSVITKPLYIVCSDGSAGYGDSLQGYLQVYQEEEAISAVDESSGGSFEGAMEKNGNFTLESGVRRVDEETDRQSFFDGVFANNGWSGMYTTKFIFIAGQFAGGNCTATAEFKGDRIE